MDIWNSWWVLQIMQLLGFFSFWVSFAKFRTLFSRAFGYGHKVVKGDCSAWIFVSSNGLVTVGSFLFFLLVISWVYLFAFPTPPTVIKSYETSNGSVSPVQSHDIPNSSQLSVQGHDIPNSSHPFAQSYDEILKSNVSMDTCNVFEGSWVRDDSYPLYDASQCPFAERGFNCLANGRKDRGYTKWRWKPKNCEIPKFDARRILEQLRGKRVVFVGDSLSRTQWESMICLLMTGVENKKSVYEIKGNKITKQIRFLGVRFSTFDVRVDFYRSVFLVKPGSVPRHAPQRVKTTLRLDKIDDISNEWIDSDFLIFNSGHWWTRTKLFDMGWYFQVGNSLKLGMSINSAFKTALLSWASWVENAIDTNRTRVFFRTFESSHWSGQNHNSCKVTQKPWKRTNGKERSPISDMISKVVKNMSTPVTVLHVTPMTAYRSDGHVGTWSDKPSVPDCSHWCLPGVPDMWNEILLSYLLPKEEAN
ncbi:protein trichome berefringence-like 7 [Vigna radiata var. radiata]|uniref:Protein trichome berefringence-like 7 n=1 Tax=Vigna radiata var. radiata TaxID=3916 RepID=A0A1S3VWB8_VIGRR|nr:protein trichome berefringence-like 7 [Vigna radiata var. radiata]